MGAARVATLRTVVFRVSVVTARITVGRRAGGVAAGVVIVVVLRIAAVIERVARAGAVQA